MQNSNLIFLQYLYKIGVIGSPYHNCDIISAGLLEHILSVYLLYQNAVIQLINDLRKMKINASYNLYILANCDTLKLLMAFISDTKIIRYIP